MSGETIYVPAREDKKAWGETSGYQQYIRERNRGKYQLFIDTENQTPDKTAEWIGTFINRMSDESSEV